VHQLYYLARGLDLGEQKIRDPEHHNPAATTIAEAWLRPVLLALAQSNQLRSNELSQLFSALEQWRSQASIIQVAGDGSIQVDLFADHPLRKTDQEPSGEHVLTISTDSLA